MAFAGLSFLLQPVRSAEGGRSFAGLVSTSLKRLLCNLERVSVSCSGTAVLWHGLA